MKDLPLKIMTKQIDVFEAVSSTSHSRSGTTFETLTASSRGFARSNPDRLLENLGLSEFSRGRRNKEQAILSFLAEAIACEIEGERLMSIVFENPQKRGREIIVKVKTYEVSDGSRVNATNDNNCKRFINSLLLAGAKLDKIIWDDEYDKCFISLESGTPVAVIKIM